MTTHTHEPESDEQRRNASSSEQTNETTFGDHPLSTRLMLGMGAGKPPNVTPENILRLQQTAGNQAVRRMLMQQAIQRIPETDPPRMSASERREQMSTQRHLNFITIKLLGRGIEHWWIEIDGTESYGWWPVRDATDTGDAAWNHGIMGVPGELNAVSRAAILHGSPTRDPHHGDTAPESFHPHTFGRADSMSDDEIRRSIRSFARGFSGDYRIIGGPNCHTFIQVLMRSVGLSMGRASGTRPNVPSELG